MPSFTYLGNKYDIPALKDLAARKYQEMVKDKWNNPTFAESARLVYDNIVSDKDNLRDIIVDAARENLADLIDRGEFVGLLRENGEMETDILVSVCGSGGSRGGVNGKNWKCQHCNCKVTPTCNYCGNEFM